MIYGQSQPFDDVRRVFAIAGPELGGLPAGILTRAHAEVFLTQNQPKEAYSSDENASGQPSTALPHPSRSRRRFAARRVSACELTEAVLWRIEALNPTLGAFTIW